MNVLSDKQVPTVTDRQYRRVGGAPLGWEPSARQAPQDVADCFHRRVVDALTEGADDKIWLSIGVVQAVHIDIQLTVEGKPTPTLRLGNGVDEHRDVVHHMTNLHDTRMPSAGPATLTFRIRRCSA